MHLEWPQSAKMAYFNANNSSSPEIQRSDSKTPRPLPWWANRDPRELSLLTSPFYPATTPQRQVLSPGPISQTLPAHTSYQDSSMPLLKPPSELLTILSIPSECFEEFVDYPPDRNETPKMKSWGRSIFFKPIQLYEQGVLGTPMRACLYGSGLKDPDERVFQSLAEAGHSSINFKIIWPGYPWLNWTVPISIYGLDGGFITRRELAYWIAVQYHNFTQACEFQQWQCQQLRWRVGPGGYTFDRMRLSFLESVGGNIWQAYIRVLTDREGDPSRRWMGEISSSAKDYFH